MAEIATLGGGCFWCLEAVFEQLQGVEKVESGYTGGRTENPSYHQVCSGSTGHAEVVQVTFDPTVLTYDALLDVFFSIHDPTTLNRQGADEGTQYRSVIYWHTPEQKRIAEEKIKQINEAKIWPRPLVTELSPLQAYFPAEEYHQHYYQQHPGQGYCVAVINPKLAKFRNYFSDRMKTS